MTTRPWGVTVEPQEQEPRVASLHDLMRDIGALRRRLEADLTLTAAALEHGELAVADELLDASLAELEVFEVRGLAHLDQTPAWATPVTWIAPPSTARRRLRAVAVAASFAAVALVLQAGPATQNTRVSTTALPADVTVTIAPEVPVVAIDLEQTFADLRVLEASPSKPEPVQIEAVAKQLFAQAVEIKDAKVVNQAKTATALAALRQQDKILVANNTGDVLSELVKQNTMLIDNLTATLDALTKGLLPAAPATTPTPPSLGQVLGSP